MLCLKKRFVSLKTHQPKLCHPNTKCLSVSDNFMGLALKGLMICRTEIVPFLDYCTISKGFKYSGSRILISAGRTALYRSLLGSSPARFRSRYFMHHFNAHSSQLIFTYSRLTIETLENSTKAFVPSKHFNSI